MQIRGSIKAFVAKPLGRLALLAFIALVLAGSVLYTNYFLAIPIFLLVGLGLPIYLGWTRPRTILLVGLSALLIAPPIVTAGAVSTLLVPTPPASGPVFAPFTHSVLENATVHPYVRAAGGSFSFTVDVNPAYLPNGSQPAVRWVDLFLATCPNALSNATPACVASGPYLFHFANQTYNSSRAGSVQFNQTVGGVNVWWWTMAAGFVNSTGGVSWIYLQANTGYLLIEGPVTGDYLGLYEVALPLVYFSVFAYPGLVFFLAALIYIFLKMRQRRRAGGAPTVPGTEPPAEPGTPGTSTPASPGTATAPSAPKRAELACPQCGAVVYAGESRCWKCGTPLPGTPPKAADAPLPSRPP